MSHCEKKTAYHSKARFLQRKRPPFGHASHHDHGSCPAGTGILFRRTDLPGQPEVPADSRCITSTMRATTLEKGPAKVFTVEHLLSALYALKIDNCIIEMDSPELP